MVKFRLHRIGYIAILRLTYHIFHTVLWGALAHSGEMKGLTHVQGQKWANWLTRMRTSRHHMLDELNAPLLCCTFLWPCGCIYLSIFQCESLMNGGWSYIHASFQQNTGVNRILKMSSSLVGVQQVIAQCVEFTVYIFSNVCKLHLYFVLHFKLHPFIRRLS